MKFLIIQATALYASLSVLASIFPPHSVTDQKPFGTTSTISEPDRYLQVPGSNNATYGPVPRSEQLFEIEFLSIAPSPWELDRHFFTLLRGYIVEPELGAADITNHDLTTATVKISLNCVLADGRELPHEEYETPLRTIAFTPWAHISIRSFENMYSPAKFTDYLKVGMTNDILTDYMHPAIFMEKGLWTFGVRADLEDGRCLFAIELTQWLEGKREVRSGSRT